MKKVNSKNKILLLLLSLIMVLETFIPYTSIADANDDSVDVGEVVYYLPEYREIEITEDESGYYSWYDNYYSKGMWRVIDKKSDGTLILTSMYPENLYVTLEGENGYNNGVNTLNKIADELYSDSSLNIRARSINMEDIDSMLKSETLNSINAYIEEAGFSEYSSDGALYYPSMAGLEKNLIIDEAVFADGLGRSDEADLILDYSVADASIKARLFCGYDNYYLPDEVKNDAFKEVFYSTETYLPSNYDITNIKNYLIGTGEACTEMYKDMTDEEVISSLNSLLSNKSFWIASRGEKDTYNWDTSTNCLGFGIMKYESDMLMPKSLFKSDNSISSGRYCLSVILEMDSSAITKVGNTFRVETDETTIVPVIKLEYTTDIIEKINSSNEEKLKYNYFYDRDSILRQYMPYEEAQELFNEYGEAFLKNPYMYAGGGYRDSGKGSSDPLRGSTVSPNGQNEYKYNYSSTIPYYLNYADSYTLDVMPNDGIYGLYSDIECTDLVALSTTGTVNGQEFPGFYYFENVPSGVYFVKEIEPPSGFKKGYTTIYDEYNLTEKEQAYIQFKQNKIERMYGGLSSTGKGGRESGGYGYQLSYDISHPLMNYGIVKIDRNNMGEFNPVFFYNEKVEMDFYKIEGLTGSKLDGAKLAIIDPDTNEPVEQETYKFTRSSNVNKPFQSYEILLDAERSYWGNGDEIITNLNTPVGNAGGELYEHYYDYFPYFIEAIENGNIVVKLDEWDFQDTVKYNHMGNIFGKYYLDWYGVDVNKETNELVWVTGDSNNPNKVSYLTEGKDYILRELEAPDGYAKAPDITFKVVDGKLVTMTDTKMKNTFSHFVEGENGEYAGAEVKVTDANGTVIDSWTTTNEPHTIDGLVDGKAYYYEVTSEEAGIIVPEKVLFVAENNKNVSITAHKLLTTIKVIKVDSKTNEPILNNHFEFGLFKDEACTKLVENASSNKETGEVTFAGVPFGTYYVKETKAPTEYQIKDTVYTVVIDENLPEVGKTYSITVSNEKIVMALADIETKTNNQLIDAEIQVIDKETKEVVDQWINTKTVHTIKNLEDGKTYIMRQIKVPDGYYIAEDIEFIAGDGEEVIMKNDLILTNLVVKLLDEETREVIKDGDFEFKLYKDEACTEEAGTGTINKDTGTATFKNLEFGTYYIDQSKVPLNYSKTNTDPVKLVVNNSLPGIGETTNVTVLNRTGKEGSSNNNNNGQSSTVVPQTVMPSIVINNNNNNVVTVNGEDASGVTRVVVAGPSDGTVRTVSNGTGGTTTTYTDTSSMKYDPDELKGSGTIVYNVPNTESNTNMYYYIAAALLVTFGLGIVIFEKVRNEKTNKK